MTKTQKLDLVTKIRNAFDRIYPLATNVYTKTEVDDLLQNSGGGTTEVLTVPEMLETMYDIVGKYLFNDNLDNEVGNTQITGSPSYYEYTGTDPNGIPVKSNKAIYVEQAGKYIELSSDVKMIKIYVSYKNNDGGDYMQLISSNSYDLHAEKIDSSVRKLIKNTGYDLYVNGEKVEAELNLQPLTLYEVAIIFDQRTTETIRFGANLSDENYKRWYGVIDDMEVY